MSPPSAWPTSCMRGSRTPTSRRSSRAGCTNSSPPCWRTSASSAAASSAPTWVRYEVLRNVKFTITHEFSYRYDSPVRLSTQYLRLTPRDTVRQKVTGWKLDTPGAALRTTDGYGNVLHVLTIDKPVSEIAIEAAGRVETAPALDEPSDFTGAPLPPLLFLRPTGLTRLDEARSALAEKFRAAAATHAGLRELASAISQKYRG